MLFSIIIPTYNCAAMLKRALLSIQQQTFKDFEVIISDDGSSDNAKETADEFSSRFTMRFLQNQHWGGPARPRNKALSVAKGDFVAFLDADDWWYPRKLETISKNLNDADVIFHDLDIFTQKGKSLFKKVKGRYLRKPVFVDLMTNANALMTSGVIVRKDAIHKIGGLREEEALISVEDFDLWLRIAKISEKFKYVPQSLGAYWMDASNISAASAQQLERIQAVYRRHLDDLAPEEKKQAEKIMSYLMARTKQKVGLTDEALQLFAQSAKSTNKKFMLRSLCWIALIRLFYGNFKR